ncbi:MAG: radical SAM protein [Planctomycetota bacterium]|jgi:MoaA/NifB/PqqE/SkfB family radical SAM enzyme
MKLSRYYYNLRYAFIWNKPQLTYRLARSVFDVVVRRKQPLRYIDVNVGLACNLTCEHCFAENFKVKDRSPLSNEEWRDVITQCRELGATAIGFTGGEPLVHPRLFDLIRYCCPEKMLTAVCTNGTLLTLDMAKRLKDAAVDVVQISLDSAIAEEHDKFRAKDGAYDKTLQAFDNALAAGLRAAVVPTVSHFNINSDGFNNIITWAREKGLLVNLSLAAPVGEWAENTDCLLTDEDMAQLDHLVRTTPHVRRDFESNYWSMGCGAATEKIYITPVGDIIPCPFMHISFGNVHDHSVAAIRDRMLENRYLKGFHPKCLTAEDRTFIDNYLPKNYLKGKPLPTAQEIFEDDGSETSRPEPVLHLIDDA